MKVEQIWSDDIEVTAVTSGENVKIKVKGIDDSEVSPGFVLCSLTNPIKTGKVFDAQVGRDILTTSICIIDYYTMNMFQIVMLDLKSIVCAGFGCIMHLQAMAEEVCHIDHSMMFNYNNIFLLQVTIKALICLVDKKTGEKTKGLRFVKQDQIAIVR